MNQGAYKNHVFTRARVRDPRVLALALALLALVLAPLLAFAAPAADLGSADLGTRLAAIRELGTSGGGAGAAELRAALPAEKSPLAREAIVDALGRLHDAAAVPALLDAAAKDTDLGVRTGAVAALHQIGDPGAWGPLERLAADAAQPAQVRRGCLLVVGAREGARALKTLAGAAGDKDSRVREAAVEALGRVDSPEARTAVDRAAADADATVRAAARARIAARKPPATRGGRP